MTTDPLCLAAIYYVNPATAYCDKLALRRFMELETERRVNEFQAALPTLKPRIDALVDELSTPKKAEVE